MFLFYFLVKSGHHKGHGVRKPPYIMPQMTEVADYLGTSGTEIAYLSEQTACLRNEGE